LCNKQMKSYTLESNMTMEVLSVTIQGMRMLLYVLIIVLSEISLGCCQEAIEWQRSEDDIDC
jgi:hypothetical protein